MKPSTRISRRSCLLLLGSGTLAALVTGCGQTGPAAAPPPGGTAGPVAAPPAKKAEAQKLTAGLLIIPSHFDPHRNASATHLLAFQAVFGSLTDFDAKGNLQSALATSWKPIAATTWEFKLRPGAKFQNGEPFDAETVKWNVERVLDPSYVPNIKAGFSLLTGAKAISADTVHLTTSEPDPILPRRLGIFHLIPPAYYNQVGEQGFLSKPIGTGPWRVKTFQRDERFVLERVEGSWRGVPKLAEMTMVAMPEASSRVAALKTGEIDIAGYVATDQAEAIRQSGLVVKSIVVQRIMVVALDNVKDTPLKDKRVRQALNYAVDKEALVRNIMQGYGQVVDGQVVGPDGFGYNPKLKAYPFDPAKAKQLLAEAGFPNGFDISMHSTVAAYPNDKETAEAIVGYLANVGVRVKLELNESADQLTKRREGKLHPMYLHTYNYSPIGDADFTLRWWDSKKTAVKVATYNNPEFDKAYWASQTETDSEKRLKQLQQASEVMHGDPAVIFLFQFADLYGLQKTVQNFEPRPDSLINWDVVSKAG